VTAGYTLMAMVEPDPALTSYLNSWCDASYREMVGAMGMLRLIEPTRAALRAYEERLVHEARAEGHSWAEIGAALGIPKQTAHRKFGP